MGARFSLFTDNSLPYTNYLSNDALFKIQSDVIRKLASEKSCLFVGRCADYILRENPHCVNVFITASLEDRVKRLCDNNLIFREEAEELIVKTDKKRAAYYNYYSYKTWGAAPTYHLCIDSSALGIEETVLFIEDFAAKRLKYGRNSVYDAAPFNGTSRNSWRIVCSIFFFIKREIMPRLYCAMGCFFK